jgi:CxxC-x17-CxxC domain-containing protein
LAYVDKEIACKDCGNSFVFTAGEQEFYAAKGLQNEPARCPRCRTARRTARAQEPEEGYVRYGVFASFGGKTPRQMHPAACAECGVMTEVPFIPRGDRPVYCSSCYNKVRGATTPRAAT